MMKKINSVIFLSVLVLFLLVGCVSSSSNLVKSGEDNDWLEFDDNDDGDYSYKKVNIDKMVKIYSSSVGQKGFF